MSPSLRPHTKGFVRLFPRRGMAAATTQQRPQFPIGLSGKSCLRSTCNLGKAVSPSRSRPQVLAAHLSPGPHDCLPLQRPCSNQTPSQGKQAKAAAAPRNAGAAEGGEEKRTGVSFSEGFAVDGRAAGTRERERKRRREEPSRCTNGIGKNKAPPFQTASLAERAFFSRETAFGTDSDQIAWFIYPSPPAAAALQATLIRQNLPLVALDGAGA
ncbi:uncharacterized protein LOC120301205 [Crotalus tigris]|uniref:uncharacterized protein LOC120301205 n=1 Tax=Crotalus tigris TaxID=88082 RepID=UPI00192F2FCB|nr:uncharacterized protein LOC120301205 [Crotalus tigris]